MKPKKHDALVPALSLPSVKPLSISAASAGKPAKLPGVAQPSGKDPKKMAEQLKNPRPKKPKVEVLKTDKNGQWSLDKTKDEDKIHVSTSVHDLPEKGTAYLVDHEGGIRAKFHNGNMPKSAPAPNIDEPTQPTSKSGECNSV